MEKTILVVSDHLHLQEGIRHGLEQVSQDIRVIQAYNAGQAACRVMDHHPDMLLICDLIPAGSFSMPPVVFGASVRAVCLAFLDFIRHREEELGLPRAAMALITCHGQKLAAEMESCGLTQACDQVLEVPCPNLLANVMALLQAKVGPVAESARPVRSLAALPLAPILPVAGQRKDRKRRARKARSRKQSCVVELLEGRGRKRGA